MYPSGFQKYDTSLPSPESPMVEEQCLPPSCFSLASICSSRLSSLESSPLPADELLPSSSPFFQQVPTVSAPHSSDSSLSDHARPFHSRSPQKPARRPPATAKPRPQISSNREYQPTSQHARIRETKTIPVSVEDSYSSDGSSSDQNQRPVKQPQKSTQSDFNHSSKNPPRHISAHNQSMPSWSTAGAKFSLASEVQAISHDIPSQQESAMSDEVRRRLALEKEVTRLRSEGHQRAMEEQRRSETLQARLARMEAQLHPAHQGHRGQLQRDANGMVDGKFGWDALTGLLWDKKENGTESGAPMHARDYQQQLQAHRALLKERENQIRELQSTLAAEQVRTSRLERRLDALTASLEDSQNALDRLSDQKAEELRQMEEAKNRDKSILIQRLQRANEEREQQEAVISQASLKLEDSSRDIAILRGDLLSKQKNLREAHERARLLEAKLLVYQGTKQTFFGFRILSPQQQIPVTLGLVEGITGSIVLRIATCGDQVLLELSQLSHVAIIASPNHQATRLTVQTASAGVLVFDMMNEMAAHRCYLLLTTLGAAAARCEQQQRNASSTACLSQLESFFFGDTSPQQALTVVPDGSLMSLVDLIKEEDVNFYPSRAFNRGPAIMSPQHQRVHDQTMDPRMHDPRIHDPRMQDQLVHDQRMHELRMHGPRMHDSRYPSQHPQRHPPRSVPTPAPSDVRTVNDFSRYLHTLTQHEERTHQSAPTRRRKHELPQPGIKSAPRLNWEPLASKKKKRQRRQRRTSRSSIVGPPSRLNDLFDRLQRKTLAIQSQCDAPRECSVDDSCRTSWMADTSESERDEREEREERENPRRVVSNNVQRLSHFPTNEEVKINESELPLVTLGKQLALAGSVWLEGELSSDESGGEREFPVVDVKKKKDEKKKEKEKRKEEKQVKNEEGRKKKRVIETLEKVEDSSKIQTDEVKSESSKMSTKEMEIESKPEAKIESEVDEPKKELKIELNDDKSPEGSDEDTAQLVSSASGSRPPNMDDTSLSVDAGDEISIGSVDSTQLEMTIRNLGFLQDMTAQHDDSPSARNSQIDID